jgi:diadenosine tetraphosphate (Ap4A) HIT family hydrolase
MKDSNCAYCMREEKPELYEAFGYFVMKLKVSDLYLFKEQSHKGRCIVAYKDHVSEMCDLSKEEREAFIEDVNAVATAIHKIFNPNKLNYGFYGDTGKHLHCHLCPKYKDGFEWGLTFAMNPKQLFATEEELKEMAEALKAELSK